MNSDILFKEVTLLADRKKFVVKVFNTGQNMW